MNNHWLDVIVFEEQVIEFKSAVLIEGVYEF